MNELKFLDHLFFDRFNNTSKNYILTFETVSSKFESLPYEPPLGLQ